MDDAKVSAHEVALFENYGVYQYEENHGSEAPSNRHWILSKILSTFDTFYLKLQVLKRGSMRTS